MKLYYSPGTCSLSPHIILREAGAKFDLEKVDGATKKTTTGKSFLAINPKGYVPVLELDDGQILTEGAAIVQYIADSHPGARLAPNVGTIERSRMQEHLNFTASELHKSFGPLFSPVSSDESKKAAVSSVKKNFNHFEKVLSDGRAYLVGDQFTPADTYLFAVSSWAGPTGIGLSDWPYLEKHNDRIAARPKVREAMMAEGLLAK
jgi:glutathione S-transferase